MKVLSIAIIAMFLAIPAWAENSPISEINQELENEAVEMGPELAADETSEKVSRGDGMNSLLRMMRKVQENEVAKKKKTPSQPIRSAQ